ncbi:hypothetical protein GCM10010503_19390 [Streptomyces lucensis JCM 4490]|uniref:Integral membrane protein n=1 Tax=Streptomyces lucensis JCM 4490 TaxID=1306176 RepID=A0A918J4U0_9ACTN|nr:hypothetical protein [Streptomyces lucensis]GGW42970.1 hypothetical protein GCM10010503_19390 [Streptomyces lucensis JCM 4490]
MADDGHPEKGPGGPGTGRRLLWRWRSNPLRRRDDVVEACIVLAVWLIVAVGGAAVGVLTGRAADGAFARERAERRPVAAALLQDVTGTAGQGSGLGGDRVMAEVRWTTSDGSVHTGRAMVRSGQAAGARVTVWTDPRGDLRPEPRTGTEARTEAVLFGGAAALALAGAALAAGGGARYWLTRRRVDAWGREWDLVGPRWTHKTG